MLIVYLTVLSWSLGGVALARAAWARRRGSAMASIGVAAVAMYLVEFIGGAWAPARRLSVLSPFHYYQASAVLAGTAEPSRDLSILAAVGAIAVVLAYWRFQRRDL